MLSCLSTPVVAAPAGARRTTSHRSARLVARAGDNHVSAAHNEPLFGARPQEVDWDDLPMITIDSETARHSIISFDEFEEAAPPPPAPQAAQQDDGPAASFLHVWTGAQDAFGHAETYRNSMESVDVFIE